MCASVYVMSVRECVYMYIHCMCVRVQCVHLYVCECVFDKCECLSLSPAVTSLLRFPPPHFLVLKKVTRQLELKTAPSHSCTTQRSPDQVKPVRTGFRGGMYV